MKHSEAHIESQAGRQRARAREGEGERDGDRDRDMYDKLVQLLLN